MVKRSKSRKTKHSKVKRSKSRKTKHSKVKRSKSRKVKRPKSRKVKRLKSMKGGGFNMECYNDQYGPYLINAYPKPYLDNNNVKTPNNNAVEICVGKDIFDAFKETYINTKDNNEYNELRDNNNTLYIYNRLFNSRLVREKDEDEDEYGDGGTVAEHELTEIVR